MLFLYFVLYNLLHILLSLRLQFKPTECVMYVSMHLRMPPRTNRVKKITGRGKVS